MNVFQRRVLLIPIKYRLWVFDLIFLTSFSCCLLGVFSIFYETLFKTNLVWFASDYMNLSLLGFFKSIIVQADTFISQSLLRCLMTAFTHYRRLLPRTRNEHGVGWCRSLCSTVQSSAILLKNFIFFTRTAYRILLNGWSSPWNPRRQSLMWIHHDKVVILLNVLRVSRHCSKVVSTWLLNHFIHVFLVRRDVWVV